MKSTREPKAKSAISESVGVFDIGDAKAFLPSIKQVYLAYCNGKAKSTEELLYVVMGLNHLREWIAPGYKKKGGVWPKPIDAQQKFSQHIFEDANYTVVRHLCNQTKHGGIVKTNTDYGLTIGEWPSIDAVKSFDLGSPSAHSVGQRSVSDVIDPLIQLYDDWFSGKWTGE